MYPTAKRISTIASSIRPTAITFLTRRPISSPNRNATTRDTIPLVVITGSTEQYRKSDL